MNEENDTFAFTDSQKWQVSSTNALEASERGTVWPDLAKFHHLSNILKGFDHFLSNYLVFGKIVNLLRQIFYAFGKISLF